MELEELQLEDGTVLGESQIADPRPKRKHRATGKPVGRPKGSKDWSQRTLRTNAQILADNEGIALEAAATLIKERQKAFKDLVNQTVPPPEYGGEELPNIRISGNGIELTPSEEFIEEVLGLAVHARRADEISEIVSTIITFDTYAESDAMAKLVTWMRDLVLLNGGWEMEGDKGTLNERISFTRKLVKAEQARKKWLNQFDSNSSAFVWAGIPLSTLPPQAIVGITKKKAPAK
jgi:hypothetical protein